MRKKISFFELLVVFYLYSGVRFVIKIKNHFKILHGNKIILFIIIVLVCLKTFTIFKNS